MTLDGGLHTSGDTLRVTDNASLDDDDFANMSGIENLVLLGTGAQISARLRRSAPKPRRPASFPSTPRSDGLGATIHAFDYVTAGLTVTTGLGDDDVQTGGGNDTITTGAGDDQICRSRRCDTFNGGAGDDILEGVRRRCA
jgi:Ca2+-binding RTX toxin-like protein